MLDEELKKGLMHGFVDGSVEAIDESAPRLLTNDPANGEKVLTSLKAEMDGCDEFMFYVAFVTFDGVSALLGEFRSLLERGVKGRIVASQYQNFTQPKALRKLASMENIDLRIVAEEGARMHSKCYIFRKGGYYDIIIGSSNLTNGALCSNGEWNLRFDSKGSGALARSILDEFERSFARATPVTPEWIDAYSLVYDEIREYRREAAAGTGILRRDSARIVPNAMQAEALRRLKALRDAGERRALVVSATGSGKTYLAAFDAMAAGGRCLYLVHRRPILERSMRSFRRVMGPSARVEKYDESRNDLDADCLFCTVQTMSRPETLERIPPETFDYILVDEVHHVGAESYRRILDHFRPGFLLGMTATPDRADGYDVYGAFDHNIAYEIRLKQAMEMGLICPFHYFGIADLEIDGEERGDLESFRRLEIERRADHVIENAEFYGYDGDRVRGLVFCSRVDEARAMSALFNARGYRTAWVSGRTRDEADVLIERLESDSDGLALDYIFVADLFNEGVDIPSVNQIIMLRPTESPVVYIQQLGRGLRLHPGKGFVTVLDFIGNYRNAYSIPAALSDDRSRSKVRLRRFLATGDSVLPGNSTISFDEVSRAAIYRSIDSSSPTRKVLLDAYRELKGKLGRIPRLTDFREHGAVDALGILKRYGSYHGFLETAEPEYRVELAAPERRALEFVTRICASGKRLLEVESVEALMSGGSFSSWLEGARPDLSEDSRTNILNILGGTYFKGSPRLLAEDRASPEFAEMLEDADFRRHVEGVLALGRQSSADYAEKYEGTDLVLYQLYSYEDAFRLLRMRSDSGNYMNVGGYRYDAGTNTFPVFINYEKGGDVPESQRYEDRFEGRDALIALSKSRDGRDSRNMVRVRDHAANGTAIHLFVRKNKDDRESKEFYYLGMMDFDRFLDDGRPVKVRYRLRNALRADLYDYFESRRARAPSSTGMTPGRRRDGRGEHSPSVRAEGIAGAPCGSAGGARGPMRHPCHVPASRRARRGAGHADAITCAC